MHEKRLCHHVAFATHIGRTHRVNQDAGGAWTCTRTDGTPASLAVVADGVSAGPTSEEASKAASAIVAERVMPLLRAETGFSTVVSGLLDAVQEAQREIAGRPYRVINQADATTLAVALAVGERAVAMWVGDSRVYLIRGESVRALTRDHSWAEEVVSAGLMSADEAASDPRSRSITRWLGPPGQRDPGAESLALEASPGSTLLCASDGLYLYFERDLADLARTLNQSPSLQDGVEALIRLGLERGGHDDLTLAAIKITD